MGPFFMYPVFGCQPGIRLAGLVNYRHSGVRVFGRSLRAGHRFAGWGSGPKEIPGGELRPHFGIWNVILIRLIINELLTALEKVPLFFHFFGRVFFGIKKLHYICSPFGKGEHTKKAEKAEVAQLVEQLICNQ